MCEPPLKVNAERQCSPSPPPHTHTYTLKNVSCHLFPGSFVTHKAPVSLKCTSIHKVQVATAVAAAE